MSSKLILVLVAVLGFTAILYYISAAVAADVIDTPLKAGLSNGAIPGLDAALYVFVTETSVLALAFYVVVIASFHDRVAAACGLIAIPAGFIVMIIISLVGISTYTGFQITFDNLLVMPLLFDLYVLHNPAIGLGIQGILFCICFGVLVRINEVAQRG